MKYFTYIFIVLIFIAMLGGFLESNNMGDGASFLLWVFGVALVFLLYKGCRFFFNKCWNEEAPNKAVVYYTGEDEANARNVYIEDKFVDTVMNQNEKSKEIATQDTQKLVSRVLTEIGCQPHEGEEGDIVFKYQGETFVIKTQKGNHFIGIHDFAWCGLELDNPDIDSLKEAVNNANLRGAVQCTYTIDSDKGVMTLHCYFPAYIWDGMPALNDYITAILGAFFGTHETVHREFLSIRNTNANTK